MTTAAEGVHLRGVGWTHTASLGDPTRDETVVACGAGLTPCSDSRCTGTLGCVFPPEGLRADLSSDYWGGVIDESTAIAIPSYVPCLGPIGAFSNDAACPACGHFFPEMAIWL